MSSLLGVINHVASTIVPEAALCFQTALRKFPSSFTDAEKINLPRFSMLGDFQTYTADGATVYFFGEIFNRNEIATIASTAHLCSNAQLVHALFVAKGTDAVKSINGQFVIVYYEWLQKRISIINDHLGVQQLVYYHDKDIFLFGTEVKLLLSHPICPKGIDWANALRRPLPHTVLASQKSYKTWFKGINLLPEAGIVELDLNSGNATFKNYWKPQDTVSSAADNRTVSQVMDEYAALLEDAIKIRLASDGITHSLLSGGLDSSAICGLAAQHGTIETFSIINQTTVLEDTTSYCHRMSIEQQFKNTQFLVPYHNLCFNKQLWMQRIWRAESPVNHTDSLTKTMLHYAIKKNYPEVRALLTGTGSDQMNGGLVGYISQVTDDKEESWNSFYNEILDVENRKLIARNEESLWQVRKFVSRDFLSTISNIEIEKNQWMVCVESAIHSQAYSLLWDEQRASSSHGHITFYPFLDFRIAEFIASVPPHMHKYLFLDKQILREPAKKFIPEYIVSKPKMPYNLPEYDFRAELYEFLTADGPESLLNAAFGDIDTPHPAIDKKHLYARIKAMRKKPEIMEWLNIMHIINLGLLEKLAEKEEKDLLYEEELDVPETITFDDPIVAKRNLEKRLGILTTNELIDKPVCFAENCSFLFDTKNNKYYLSKRGSLTYEIEEEYKDWKRFLEKIDNRLTAREILVGLGIEFDVIEEFYMLTLKEQILTISDKRTGY